MFSTNLSSMLAVVCACALIGIGVIVVIALVAQYVRGKEEGDAVIAAIIIAAICLMGAYGCVSVDEFLHKPDPTTNNSNK